MLEAQWNMEKDKAYEKYQDLLEKLIDKLENVDRHKRAHVPIQSTINWLLALSVGTLLWLLSNLDTFKNEYSKIDEYTVLLSAILHSLSTLIFGMVRSFILLREIAINVALDSIQSIPDKIRFREKNSSIFNDF